MTAPVPSAEQGWAPLLKYHQPGFHRRRQEGDTMSNVKELSVVFLLALLVGVWVWAFSAWTSDIPMSNWVALGFGGLFTLIVGSGLIGLMFYSSRRGYDDEAFRKRGPK